MIAPALGHCILVTFSRHGSYLWFALKQSNTCPRKQAHIICYMLEFTSTFIKCHACEELESNAKCSRNGVHSIDVKNTHECYMKFDNVRIILTCAEMRDFGMKSVTYW